ncbi:3-oxoacyl-[acyl-carrier-protein] synthase III C-terminal domain-containing protein [Microvirga flavescens]|uniref:3-oxoacyl-[acyl-carrier-protein] synthase III C-terminal domain-containing protein n=1 Tax=Microvirga flavescens TaxID=2249811 RepID=UPI000DDA760A|nr:3-oxoacyl-[acyl-carrier-protein] synthase III C-terminal domain-containing protein [Microvirga flavescens]
MSSAGIGILGVGYAVPNKVRLNDDPIFEALRSENAAQDEAALFYGNRERRVLQEGESLSALTVQACEAALLHARLQKTEIDRLYGYVSVSEYVAPNALYEVHQLLGLPTSALVVPIQSEFTNFLLGTILAREAIIAGSAQRIIVAAGAGWTRNIDYKQGHSVGIGDGAGAAVLGLSDRMVITDWAIDTFSDEYGAMVMKRWPDRPHDHPTYGIDPAFGIKAFMSSGMNGPPRLVLSLLAKHGIRASDVTLITHQATRKLMDHWANAIQPGAYLDTFEAFGNLVIASIPISLACFFDKIETPWLVMAGLGIGAHQGAILVRC